MKIQLFMAIASGLVLTTLASAQFSSSDDFSSGLGNWTAGATSSGTLSIYNNALNFTDSAHATSTYFASEDWNLNRGSSTADWSVQVDFTLPSGTPVAGEYWSWNFYLRDFNNSTTNFFRAFLQRTYAPVNMLEVEVKSGASDVYGGSTTSGVSNSATLVVSYAAASQTLSAWFEPIGGTTLTNFYSASVAGWGMSGSDTFIAELWANDQAQAGTTNAIGLGTFSADNFITSSTAIPEPSTEAAFAGLCALGLAMILRRKALRA